MKKEQSINPTEAGENPASGSGITIDAPQGGEDQSFEGGDGEDKENPDPDDGEGTEPTEIQELKATPLFTLSEDVVIVVCGTAQSLPLLDKAWTKKASPATICSMNVDGMSFREIIETLIADDGLPDKFVLVPESCFPTHRVSLADLIAYKVRVMNNGQRCNATGLPALIDMDVVLQVLEELSANKSLTEEEFMTAYNSAAHKDEVPIEMGHNIAGTVCCVLRPEPCRSIVAEALVRRKFINANADGFPPIEKMLTEFYG